MEIGSSPDPKSEPISFSLLEMASFPVTSPVSRSNIKGIHGLSMTDLFIIGSSIDDIMSCNRAKGENDGSGVNMNLRQHRRSPPLE